MNGNNEHNFKRIRDACDALGITGPKLENVLNIVQSYIPKGDEDTQLPDELLTGFAPIDYLLGPMKCNLRIHIYGRASSAKTSIIAHTIHSATNIHNVQALWLDSTHKLNAKFFRKFGIIDKLNFLQKSELTPAIIDMIKSEKYRIIVLDDIASFMHESLGLLERLLFYCKRNRIMVLAANQVREKPGTGMVYASRQQLLTSYDATLKSSKYKIHYEQEYSDYDLKLEYHHSNGKMEGKNIIIPITNQGYVKHDLMDKRIAKIVTTEGYSTLTEYLKDRQHESNKAI